MKGYVLPLLIALAAAVSGAVPVTISNAGFKLMLKIPDYSDVSGITWKGGTSFYIVRDGGNTNSCSVHEMMVPLDRDGSLYSSPMMSPAVTLEGVYDAEGIAFDPSTGKVWIADEAGARIGEFDPQNGKPTGRWVAVPSLVTDNIRGNLSLESLTIAGDGMTMWTANEEALKSDGDTAHPKTPTVVRLIRFNRATLSSEWECTGMWAYACDPVEKREPVYSGVSDLCALPDGSLLVLERECSYTTLGRTRIYRPNFAGATDISKMVALTNQTYVGVEKGAALYEIYDGQSSGDGFLKSQVACYEGLCLGPRNADGSVNLMMVSDGGASRDKTKLFLTASVETKPYVRALKLNGLEVCTLDFEPHAEALSDRVGSCYRYIRGEEVTVNIENATAAETDLRWTLPGYGLSGEGAKATFKVAGDDCFYWLSPEELSVRRSRAAANVSRERALMMAVVERSWRMGVGGIGSQRVRLGIDGWESEGVSVYGADVELLYGIAKYNRYGLWLGIGGAYCPQQGDDFEALVSNRGRGRMELGYGELRLLAIPQYRVSEQLSVGIRLGVAFDWMNVSTTANGEGMGGTDSDARFAAQDIFGVQATWLFTDRIGVYSNFDWRHGDESEFKTQHGESSVDMGGMSYGLGAFISF